VTILKAWSERDWDTLIRAIRNGQVVPVLGERLSLAERGLSNSSYASLLAEQMVADDRLGEISSREIDSLAQLAHQYVISGGDLRDLYDDLARAAELLTVKPAKPLAQLAGITDFNLLVSLGVDALLEDALKAARPTENIDSRAFRKGEEEDIPAAWPLPQPTVYHLFGRLSPDYVASHDDLLEVMHAQAGLRPRHLFARMAERRLLILGSAFSDWLALFFLRMSSEQRLSDRGAQIILVDDGIEDNVELGRFVAQFGKRMRLVSQSAEDFVAELDRRWQGERSEVPAIESDVFISYASENRPQAEALRNGLLEKYPRLGVWMDQQGGLESGDVYAKKIYRQIAQARVFIPILSVQTRNGEGRFYEKEWAWAEARAFELGDTPFILPVAIDQAPNYSRTDIPDTFRQLHWSQLQGGVVSDDFAKAVIRTIQAHKKQALA